jgi:hypothetical protein
MGRKRWTQESIKEAFLEYKNDGNEITAKTFRKSKPRPLRRNTISL